MLALALHVGPSRLFALIIRENFYYFPRREIQHEMALFEAASCSVDYPGDFR
jgi:hypothetical protein